MQSCVAIGAFLGADSGLTLWVLEINEVFNDSGISAIRVLPSRVGALVAEQLPEVLVLQE